MDYFKTYTSNTCAGVGNQRYFLMEENEVCTGRAFYKIMAAGEYRYSLLFSNIIDSTFADGSVGHMNLICDSWVIREARVGRCRSIGVGEDVVRSTMRDEEHPQGEIVVSDWKPMTFGGSPAKTVMPGEFFASDPVPMRFEKGDYLCLEMTFSGTMIPYHEETLLPVYIKQKDGWSYSKRMPVAGMVGCDRKVKGRIAYLGDSITQGIGTELNSYAHWSAKLAERIGEAYAHWDMGIGFARAYDAASDGAWLYKAKQNDVVFVCYGVNDLFQGRTGEQIAADLTQIAERLHSAGAKVVLQTVPPFDYTGDCLETWKSVNAYIKSVLCDKVDAVFDTVPPLCESEERPQIAKFGTHPNAEGCAAWADALYAQIGTLF